MEQILIYRNGLQIVQRYSTERVYYSATTSTTIVQHTRIPNMVMVVVALRILVLENMTLVINILCRFYYLLI